MARTLIDLESLDLSRVVAGKEEIREACQQRGDLEMIDGILHFDAEEDLAIGFKEIRATDWWAPCHIPGRPIFPGVLMCEGAAQLCTYHFMHRRVDLAGKFVGFGGMNGIRFRSTVVPDCRLILACRCTRARSKMFTYDVQGYVDGKPVFDGEILGVVV